MTRWHTASCAVPQVCVGQDSVPYCKTCSASAHECLETLKQKTHGSSSLPLIPPDKPMGQLNLSWPPTVPWTSELEVHETVMHKAAELKPSPAEAALTNVGSTFAGTQMPGNSPNSNGQCDIYKSLEHGQFRLICLEPSSKDKLSTVVHLELETHQFELCPEYETVSYSWGGEDGDSSL
ncbi:hypothetical protein FSARC_8336 [Fusarium sarcochroum]|uniref:Uncharacterized protein n=1 Tax=Fusarium sarcochroum TaxID=1208366 RepID=A0A8H4X6E9_9HYPO|nr:hypothetical protein FSARC_8336 [Fusarium sarcochroum]